MLSKENTYRTSSVKIVPLYAARIEDLGPGEIVKVDCPVCSHTPLLSTAFLSRLGLSRVEQGARPHRPRAVPRLGRARVPFVRSLLRYKISEIRTLFSPLDTDYYLLIVITSVHDISAVALNTPSVCRVEGSPAVLLPNRNEPILNDRALCFDTLKP